MADYKRMVSYMYQYENGVKKKNVGYARVEAKNGECKVTLHMQLPGLLDSIFPIYMIQRKKGDMELVYVGEAVLKAQMMDSRLTAKEANIMDSGYNLSDMGGILLFLNDSVFYATEWDDKPVVLSEVMEALKPKSKDSGKNITPPEKEIVEEVKPDEPEILEAFQTEEDEVDTSVPLYKLPRGWKTIELQQPKEGREPVNPWDIVDRIRNLIGEEQEDSTSPGQREERSEEQPEEEQRIEQRKEQRENIPEPGSVMQRPLHDVGPVYNINGGQNAAPGPYPQTGPVMDGFSRPQSGFQAMPGMGQKPESDVNNESRRIPEERIPEERFEETEKPESPLASKLFEGYPRIYPFEDNEITMCVKIEPKDIGYLPAEAWVLSNNSFLLHGYYCYNHLILAKIKERNGYRYILGVPGIYHNRERFMARMFGFDCFKSIRRRELRQGDFGYWYVPVSL